MLTFAFLFAYSLARKKNDNYTSKKETPSRFVTTTTTTTTQADRLSASTPPHKPLFLFPFLLQPVRRSTPPLGVNGLVSRFAGGQGLGKKKQDKEIVQRHTYTHTPTHAHTQQCWDWVTDNFLRATRDTKAPPLRIPPHPFPTPTPSNTLHPLLSSLVRLHYFALTDLKLERKPPPPPDPALPNLPACCGCVFTHTHRAQTSIL